MNRKRVLCNHGVKVNAQEVLDSFLCSHCPFFFFSWHLPSHPIHPALLSHRSFFFLLLSFASSFCFVCFFQPMSISGFQSSNSRISPRFFLFSLSFSCSNATWLSDHYDVALIQACYRYNKTTKPLPPRSFQPRKNPFKKEGSRGSRLWIDPGSSFPLPLDSTSPCQG
ncbi:hypothetical protein F5H01DRAFT_340039 [Linnemannia elongata]|nr:hypothetical protein F5H01DRAFT_340039 [Linnemannia elongata]